ncbi:hypothetical protein FOPE_04148 [Fonsecaea pedrosoi]|nr:hypothetical protein FOPE_04148 [Fonsecaea pedrosoi]
MARTKDNNGLVGGASQDLWGYSTHVGHVVVVYPDIRRPSWEGPLPKKGMNSGHPQEVVLELYPVPNIEERGQSGPDSSAPMHAQSRVKANEEKPSFSGDRLQGLEPGASPIATVRVGTLDIQRKI